MRASGLIVQDWQTYEAADGFRATCETCPWFSEEGDGYELRYCRGRLLNDIPDLLAEVERLRAEREAVRASLGEFCVDAFLDHGVNVLMEQYRQALAEAERLRAEVGRVCEWRTVKDNWDERHFEGACEGAWMPGDDGDTPEDGGYIYCPTCGGKVVFVGGDDDEECEEDEDD